MNNPSLRDKTNLVRRDFLMDNNKNKNNCPSNKQDNQNKNKQNDQNKNEQNNKNKQ